MAPRQTALTLSFVALATLAWSLLPQAANAEVILAYQSVNDDVGVAPSELGSGVVGLNLTRGAGLLPGSGSTFNSRGWSASSLTTAIEQDDYLEWGWDSSGPLNLQQLQLRYDRSSSGPTALAIRLAVNNSGAFTTIYEDASVADDSSDEPVISLDGFNQIQAATFRLYGWNASSQSGTFDLENYQTNPSRALTVTGTAAAVPEPTTAPVLLALSGATWLLRRRRKQKTDLTQPTAENAA